MSTVWRGIVENSMDARDFPRLFRLAKSKNSSVFDYSLNNGFCNVKWDELFVRPLLDREIEIFGHLIERVSSVILVPEVEDQLLWAHDSKGEFSVKQLSKLLLEGEGDDSIFAFDILWKLKVPPRVNNFEEFYSLCFKVKFVGYSKSLWLIAMAASYWSIWLVRNEIVFENKVLSMATLIFHTKMRALLWGLLQRATFDECMIQERLWWFCPYKCKISKSGSRGWCSPSHGWLIFNVSGIASEGASGCGGVMRDAVGSRVVYNWVLDKTRRPWLKRATFTDLERRIACVGKISFSIANINGNELAETLATAGMSRPCLFNAWW
ncbi:hypothetical protein CXB51_011284 [Gossypium anomalum]|uniref:Reverse transcriptase zinc-binding domain-containing protein n=1 Tax=Gossypium anomalum TaxID=47600 RepID=A0A8J5ZA80_9ROSI|nr:hypothetical protein CXB51_011284 [Gossypium anomalum]